MQTRSLLKMHIQMGVLSSRMYRKLITNVGNYNIRFSSSYEVEEIRIPIASVNGHLAGKLWTGPNSSDSNSLSIKSSLPIICLHGIQDNCGSFDPLIPLILKNNMKVFALDLPGHGHSYHTQGLHYDYFVDGMASIKRVLNHFGWDKATLLGHSLGSIISYVFTGTFPEQVHKYIAIDNLRPIPGFDISKSYQRIIKKLFEVDGKLASNAERPSYTYDDMLKKVMIGRKNTVTLQGNKTLLKRGAELVEGTDRYRFTHDIKTNIPSALRFLSEYQTDMLAKGITCPVCVIKGEPGEDYEPRMNFLKAVDIVSQSSENLEFHFVPGTHHFHLNEPHLVAPIINKFLET